MIVNSVKTFHINDFRSIDDLKSFMFKHWKKTTIFYSNSFYFTSKTNSEFTLSIYWDSREIWIHYNRNKSPLSLRTDHKLRDSALSIIVHHFGHEVTGLPYYSEEALSKYNRMILDIQNLIKL